MEGPARDALVLRYLPLARSAASRCQGLGLDLDDLTGEAFLGLLEAADHYDPEQGSFAAFARPYLKGRLVRALEKAPVYRMPLRLERAARRARAARAALIAAGVPRPSDAMIAARAGLDVELCHEVLSCVALPIDPDRFGVCDSTSAGA